MKITVDRALLEQAMSALLLEATEPPLLSTGLAISALHAALEAPRRKPLTESDLELMWGRAASGEGRSGLGMYATRLCAMDFARAIEAAHGIGEKE